MVHPRERRQPAGLAGSQPNRDRPQLRAHLYRGVAHQGAAVTRRDVSQPRAPRAKVQLRRGPTGFGVALRAHAVGPNAGSHPHRLGVARTAGRDDAGGDRGYPGREGGTPWRVQAVRAGRRRPGCGRRSWWRGPAQRRRRGCANQNRQQPGHGRSFGKPGPHGRKAALRAGSRSGCRWLCGHRMLISSPRGLHRWTRANRDTSIKPHQKHQDEVQRPSLSDVHKC